MAALVSHVERNMLCLREQSIEFLNVFSEPLVMKTMFMQFFMSIAQLHSVISAAYQYGLILVNNFISIYYT